MISPFISYAGSKRSLLNWLYKYFPREAKVYVEPFAGTGVVSLLKPTKTKLDVLNDINEDVINMLKCIRDDTERFAEYVLFTPIYYKDYEEYKRLAKEGKGEFVRAVNYLLYLLTTAPFVKRDEKFLWVWVKDKSDKGKERECDIRATKDQVVESIKEMGIRFRNTVFISVDYENVVRSYDKKGVFFYLDPPYPNSVIGVKDKTKGFDYERLLNVVLGIKNDFLLSLGYGEKNEEAKEIVMRFANKLEVVDKLVRTSCIGMQKRTFVEYLFTGKSTKSIPVYVKTLF
ncbi:MAG: DNA adenine methylase [Brevinematia bacterium]